MFRAIGMILVYNYIKIYFIRMIMIMSDGYRIESVTESRILSQ